ncbi:hypothetical protein AAF712_015926 [Marasmius tenuissimus]|uniref:Uncharacterized protein n=1 Tax=Marasmius tenuissimus TaxID=585030 RepID=A0ABR2Z706_9AGAR
MAQGASSATLSSSSVSVQSCNPKGNGRRNLETLRFLDLEAEVDHDKESSDEDELPTSFVVADDNDELDEPSGFSHSKELTLALVSDLPTQRIDGDDQLPPPTALWVVSCKPRKEFQVVSYAIRHALECQVFNILLLHYQKDGDGLLYLKTKDPSAAARILKDCAFILHSQDSHHHSVKMQRLDIMDSIRSLWFPSHPIEKVSWVRVSNPTFGLLGDTPSSDTILPNSQFNLSPSPRKKLQQSYYHSSLAIVQNIDPRGIATILLVPRLDAELVRLGAKARLGGRLGSPLLLKPNMGVPVEKVEALTGTMVEHGLHVKTIDAKRLTPLSEPPSLREVLLFLASVHPFMMNHLPRVKEWVFEEGEWVSDPMGYFVGCVQAVTETGLSSMSWIGTMQGC